MSAPPPPAHSTNIRWTILALLMVLAFLAHFNRSANADATLVNRARIEVFRIARAFAREERSGGQE